MLAERSPELDELSRGAAYVTTAADQGEEAAGDVATPDDAMAALRAALRDAPEDGRSVRDLMAATGMGRSWVYARLLELAVAGTAAQVARGRWVLVDEGGEAR